ncbi:MAG: alpha/beta hydrolase [Gammaproteobacteria bacterium]|nr:alpha/beta hydrolase [Gammaproteobacteria bacterium]NNC97077.1 alpha/beta hydrolase [Gammaproteobacteria bacterium]NNM14064.1 alpha/beta hydrolase [Gammaproteobacteria bacterium]
MSAAAPSMQDWQAMGEYHRLSLPGLGRHELFVIDTGETDKPVLCILHGYPTSSYDYWKALPILRQHYRVIMHDHLGFGLSDKPVAYGYQLIDQASFALELWKQLGVQSMHLLAHDYGTSVATEIIHRHNHKELDISIENVTLCNGSMHIELSQLRPIQKLLKSRFVGPLIARLASKRTLKRNFQRIYSDASKVDDQELDAIWAMMLHNNGRRVLARVTRYIDQRYTHWDRWIGALRETQLPMHILWAEDDPVAVVEMAQVISDETRNSRKTILSGLGHFPMLENAQVWTSHI